MESHNEYYLTEALELEQITQPIQSSSLEDDRGTEVHQHEYMELNNPTKLLGNHPYSF